MTFGVAHGWEPAGPALRVTEAEGTRLIGINGAPAVEALREYFDSFWGHALQNFQRAVEAPTDVHQSKESR